MELFRLSGYLSVAFTSCMLACQVATLSAQIEVPEAVLQNFQQKYPAAEKVSWNIDKNGSYEAQFEILAQKARADFDPGGEWIETEESISWKELPVAVQEAIKRDYDKDDIVELEHTVNAIKGEFYDVELNPKGKRKFDVEYRFDGTVIGIEKKKRK